MDIIETKLLRENCLPAQATTGAAGLDLRAVLDPDSFIIMYPDETTWINTGVALNMGELCAIVLMRSGLANSGLALGNAVGLIDGDYQGEIKVFIKNNSQRPIKINNRDRIAQLLILKPYIPIFKIVDNFSPSTRGENGFGSTETY